MTFHFSFRNSLYLRKVAILEVRNTNSDRRANFKKESNKCIKKRKQWQRNKGLEQQTDTEACREELDIGAGKS